MTSTSFENAEVMKRLGGR